MRKTPRKVVRTCSTAFLIFLLLMASGGLILYEIERNNINDIIFKSRESISVGDAAHLIGEIERLKERETIKILKALGLVDHLELDSVLCVAHQRTNEFGKSINSCTDAIHTSLNKNLNVDELYFNRAQSYISLAGMENESLSAAEEDLKRVAHHNAKAQAQLEWISLLKMAKKDKESDGKKKGRFGRTKSPKTIWGWREIFRRAQGFLERSGFVMIAFQHGDYLWIAPLIFLGGLFLLSIMLLRMRRTLAPYPAFRHRCASMPVEATKGLILLLVVIAAFLAILDPRKQETERVPIREGMTIAASIDCSLSMLAPMSSDNFSSRISVVLGSVHNIFSSLPHDRKGASCFSNRVYTSTVLTTDYERILKKQLNKIQEYYIATIGVGTNFSAALKGCFDLFDPDIKTRKVCIILSDGEPQGNEAALYKELNKTIRGIRNIIDQKDMKVSLYLVGVGDPSRSFKIPKRDYEGNFAGFVCCDDRGDVIETRPDPTYLQDIARTMSGTFVHISNDNDLIGVLSDIISQERKLIEYIERIVWKDMSHWLLTFIFVGLIAWFFFPKRVLFWRLQNK